MGRTRTAITIGAILSTGGLVGCGGSSGGAPAPVASAKLLQRSRTVVDATPAVHFSLASTGVTGGGIELTGGSGDLVRPDDLHGSFSVSASGLNVSVGVVEVGGHFYAEPPFASHYTSTSPAR